MIIDSFISSTKKESTKKNDPKKNSEKPIRSLVKAFSWRLVGTIDTMIISWFITGKLTMALSIGSIEVITKMILYYGHERIWNLIKWRKQ
ncbi:MAG: DUF2061 domain-containing protein [Lutibacter sp.]|uniref:DUF2061 domain-containing protein n=1 Tax=Lutibacter sp. TaxID=1925666 RepID=UPI00299D11AB|nr:DUF2061 domain-containing protein [Lutibacter sp.]MDX1828739.1 DUF2061 domain-containing protein [Lutibacter sp.]